MDNINHETALEEAILLLEMRQAEEIKLLKEEFHDTHENLKPVNLIKNIFRETVKSPETKDIIIDKIVDVAFVFSTNLMLRKTKSSFVKRAIGIALVLGIKNVLKRNPEIIEAAGTGIKKLMSNILTKRYRNRYSYTSRI